METNASDLGNSRIFPGRFLWGLNEEMYVNFLLHCCCCSVAQLCVTLRPHGLHHSKLPCPSLSSVICSNNLSMELVMWSSHLIFCNPLLLLPLIFPSIRVFSYESALRMKWPECWNFSFRISPSNEYSGLLSFRIDWFDFFAVKGLSRLFSSTTVWKHQFFGTQPSLWSSCHVHTWLLEKP